MISLDNFFITPIRGLFSSSTPSPSMSYFNGLILFICFFVDSCAEHQTVLQQYKLDSRSCPSSIIILFPIYVWAYAGRSQRYMANRAERLLLV
jgi:hypothetical protein